MPIPWTTYSIMLIRARSILFNAWNDYDAGGYEWSIRKAWLSASIATLHLNPLASEPIASRAYYSKCDLLVREASRAAVLDSFKHIVSDEWLRLVLGSTYSTPSKTDSFEALEAAAKVLDAAESCGLTGREFREPPRTAFKNSVRLGSILIGLDDGVGRLNAFERVKRYKESLHPSYYNIILTVREADEYLRLPGPSAIAERWSLETVTDEGGVASRLVKRVKG